MNKSGNILFVFGEGGHSEQMLRLCNHLTYDKGSAISLVDKKNISKKISSHEYTVPKIRNKYSVGIFNTIINLLNNIFVCLEILCKHKISVVISTGPGICILPSFIFKMLGKKIIYLETWCRFESKSNTGRFMYHIASDFYIQNIELANLYPNATYCGRL